MEILFRDGKKVETKPSPSSGFSLIEVTVSLAIAGVIALIVPTLLLNFTRFQATATAKGSMDTIAGELTAGMAQQVACGAIFGGQAIDPNPADPPTPVNIYGADGVSIRLYKTPTPTQNLLDNNINWQIQNPTVSAIGQAVDFVPNRINILARLSFTAVALDNSATSITRNIPLEFHLIFGTNVIWSCSSSSTLGAAVTMNVPNCAPDYRLNLMQSSRNSQPNWGCKMLNPPVGMVCQGSGVACVTNGNCCSGTCLPTGCY